MTDADPGAAAQRTFRSWMAIPLLIVLGVLLSFLVKLGAGDRDVLPSALLDRPAPEFELPGLGDGPAFTTADLKTGEVTIVNVWASWCIPCRHEHPWITGLANEGHRVIGLNYKDTPEGAQAFLDELGNPFEKVGVDSRGRVGIDWGVYGVPETFVVDGEGTIVYKHVGPIQTGDVSRRILPAIEAAKGNAPPADAPG